jgi:hypothetical protein
MPSRGRAEAVSFKLIPTGSFYVSARMACAAADILLHRSSTEPGLTRTFKQMVRRVRADDRPSLRWYAEDIDALLGQELGERKRRLPSVTAALHFQQVVLAQRVRLWQAGFRGRRCRDHYKQALYRVAKEIDTEIREDATVQDTALHKWVQRGMETARFLSHASRDGRL